ncbi:hypothetical protein MIB92_18550 [Aestuariirhabdus sp. Z084]|uniref:hypothetical protein n=1 Tax=Aestuariirhabdus haliotis TaxID=2918751 RepID=UPI00201B3A57|nr:hypothetical protein [Aestuariirhabdus haliotis]MCL6417666.1 hypothetical protein [Aestuariirhabdus haliotis]MCL6421607.1 hypothetical protein [Aestuariirhabdus haliotis]
MVKPVQSLALFMVLCMQSVVLTNFALVFEYMPAHDSKDNQGLLMRLQAEDIPDRSLSWMIGDGADLAIGVETDSDANAVQENAAPCVDLCLPAALITAFSISERLHAVFRARSLFAMKTWRQIYIPRPPIY